MAASVHDSVLTDTVTAEVTLWVPRGAAGDLEAGARDVLAKVDAVESIDEMDVTGFRPTANDIRVDLRTRLSVTAPRSAVADALEDGFGVLDATVADEDP